MSKTDRFTTLSAKVEDVKDGVITGIAAAYDVKISRGENLFEMLSPGVFAAQVKDPARVPILFQHDNDSPIGRVSTLTDSPERLKFAAKISQDDRIPDAVKATAMLEEGIIDEMSVGFAWQKWEQVKDETGLTIVHTRSRLKEISLVTFGALGREARVLTLASDAINVAAIRESMARLTS
jgi:HK97 family phage prohead protease